MPVCGAFYFLYIYSKIIKLIVQARTFLTLETWYNKKKVPDRLIVMNLPRTDKILLSAVPPCFPFQALFRIPAYPSQLTYAHTLWNTWLTPLTIPSAVHLISCSLSGSHHPKLSVLRISYFYLRFNGLKCYFVI